MKNVQRKKVKVKGLLDADQINVDNMKNERRVASRHFTKKQMDYLKAKINELEMNSTNKIITSLYRGIHNFKKGYQPKN